MALNNFPNLVHLFNKNTDLLLIKSPQPSSHVVFCELTSIM